MTKEGRRIVFWGILAIIISILLVSEFGFLITLLVMAVWFGVTKLAEAIDKYI